ncbi:MAG: hypothetical protein NTZ43_09155 [Gemmatimonadetes bacterium]|nr:hypothetical protein [Gemmatimonadota bacterium]
MPSRMIEIDGARWQVYPSGYVTQYDGDEFGLIFVTGTGDERTVRVTRYSPRGERGRDAALAGLSDAEVRALFATSQSSERSPEAGYAS